MADDDAGPAAGKPKGFAPVVSASVKAAPLTGEIAHSKTPLVLHTVTTPGVPTQTWVDIAPTPPAAAPAEPKPTPALPKRWPPLNDAAAFARMRELFEANPSLSLTAAAREALPLANRSRGGSVDSVTTRLARNYPKWLSS